jgi:hypothetical protein
MGSRGGRHLSLISTGRRRGRGDVTVVRDGYHRRSGLSSGRGPQDRGRPAANYHLVRGKRRCAFQDRTAAARHPYVGRPAINHRLQYLSRHVRLNVPCPPAVRGQQYGSKFANGNCVVASVCAHGIEAGTRRRFLILPAQPSIDRPQDQPARSHPWHNRCSHRKS